MKLTISSTLPNIENFVKDLLSNKKVTKAIQTGTAHELFLHAKNTTVIRQGQMLKVSLVTGVELEKDKGKNREVLNVTSAVLNMCKIVAPELPTTTAIEGIRIFNNEGEGVPVKSSNSFAAYPEAFVNGDLELGSPLLLYTGVGLNERTGRTYLIAGISYAAFAEEVVRQSPTFSVKDILQLAKTVVYANHYRVNVNPEDTIAGGKESSHPAIFKPVAQIIQLLRNMHAADKYRGQVEVHPANMQLLYDDKRKALACVSASDTRCSEDLKNPRLDSFVVMYHSQICQQLEARQVLIRQEREAGAHADETLSVINYRIGNSRLWFRGNPVFELFYQRPERESLFVSKLSEFEVLDFRNVERSKQRSVQVSHISLADAESVYRDVLFAEAKGELNTTAKLLSEEGVKLLSWNETIGENEFHFLKDLNKQLILLKEHEVYKHFIVSITVKFPEKPVVEKPTAEEQGAAKKTESVSYQDTNICVKVAEKDEARWLTKPVVGRSVKDVNTESPISKEVVQSNRLELALTGSELEEDKEFARLLLTSFAKLPSIRGDAGFMNKCLSLLFPGCEDLPTLQNLKSFDDIVKLLECSKMITMASGKILPIVTIETISELLQAFIARFDLQADQDAALKERQLEDEARQRRQGEYDIVPIHASAVGYDKLKGTNKVAVQCVQYEEWTPKNKKGEPAHDETAEKLKTQEGVNGRYEMCSPIKKNVVNTLPLPEKRVGVEETKKLTYQNVSMNTFHSNYENASFEFAVQQGVGDEDFRIMATRLVTGVPLAFEGFVSRAGEGMNRVSLPIAFYLQPSVSEVEVQGEMESSLVSGARITLNTFSVGNLTRLSKVLSKTYAVVGEAFLGVEVERIADESFNINVSSFIPSEIVVSSDKALNFAKIFFKSIEVELCRKAVDGQLPSKDELEPLVDLCKGIFSPQYQETLNALWNSEREGELQFFAGLSTLVAQVEMMPKPTITEAFHVNVQIAKVKALLEKFLEIVSKEPVSELEESVSESEEQA